MAQTGSVSVKVTDYNTLRFTWNLLNQDTLNNESTISWKLELKAARNGAIASNTQKNWSVTVDGKKYSGSASITIGDLETITIASGVTEGIEHNIYGEKTFSFYFSLNFDITLNNQVIGLIQGSGSGALDVITRGATLSCIGGAVEDTVRIYINRAFTSQKASIYYVFFGEDEEYITDYIVQNDTNSSYINWTIPTSFYDKMNYISKAICKLVCLSSFANSTKTSEIEIPIFTNGEICKPIISSFSITDSNSKAAAATGDGSRYLVKGASNAKINISATAQKQAHLRKIETICGSKKATGLTPTITEVDSGSFEVTVTDTRGHRTVVTRNLILNDYLPLTANLTIPLPTIKDNSTEATTTLQISGNCFIGWFGDNHTENAVSIKYRMKEGSGDFGAWSGAYLPIYNNNSYSCNIIIDGLDYESGYTFQVIVEDKITTLATLEQTVKATPVFDWGENDFNFNVPVTIQGDSLLDYVIEEGAEAMGADGTWHWRKWKSGKADCYGVCNFGNINISTAQGSLFSSESFTQSFPSGLFVDAPAYLSINPFGSSTAGRLFFVAKVSRPTASTTNSFYVMSPTSATIQAVYITFYAIGAWK